MYQIETFELSTSRVALFQLKAGCVIRVTGGRLWLTRQGRAEDIWLRTGECWTVPVNNVLYLSAEPTAEFQIAQALPQQQAPTAPHDHGAGWPAILWSKFASNPYKTIVSSY